MLNMDVRELTGPVLVIDCGTDSAAFLLAMPDAEPASWPRREVPAVSDADVIEAARALLAENGLERPSLSLVCVYIRQKEDSQTPQGAPQVK